MRFLGINGLLTAAVLLLSLWGATAAQTAAGPKFEEVYKLLDEHLANTSDAELNRAAVEGLVNSLRPRVLLQSLSPSASTNAEPLVSRTNVFDQAVAYLRLSRLEPGSAAAVEKALEGVRATNNLKGTVLDLRYAAGTDYAGAAQIADFFVNREVPLLRWRGQVIRSQAGARDAGKPVAVLVNSETAGAPEALAAILRETGTGLILGSQTAGVAAESKEFTLSTGQKLQIATAPLVIGNGTELPIKGVMPDIVVQVAAADERWYYADAFRALPTSDFLSGSGLSLTNPPASTNRVSRRTRFNEADLVRDRREGTGLDEPFSRSREPELPVVHDPVLARALDLVKGLAVIRQTR